MVEGFGSQLYESLKKKKLNFSANYFEKHARRSLDSSNGCQNHSFVRTNHKDYHESLYLLPQFWKHMALERELAGRKYVSGIKGSIIVVERWEAREEVVVRMVQGTIHPFGLSAIKSLLSLSERPTPFATHVFPMPFILSAFIDLPDNARVTVNFNGTLFSSSRHVV